MDREIREAASRWPAVVQGLVGARTTSVDAVGKHLLLALDDGTTIRVHRGMTGSWRWFGAGQPVRVSMEWTSLRLRLDEGTLVARHAPTVERFRSRERRVHPVLRALGPDVLGEGFDPAEAAARSVASELPTAGEVPLDQRVACGVGNVWRAELLFLWRIDPWRPPAGVALPTWTALWDDARRRLAATVEGGVRQTTDRPDAAFWVYGRAGRRCLRCGETVRAAEVGRNLPRRLFWCPGCQRD